MGELATGQQAGPRPRRWTVRLIIFGLAVVAGTMLVRELPREIARWHLAAAGERVLDQRLEAALAHLDRALDWDPDNPELLLERSSLLLELGQIEAAVELADQAVARRPNDPQLLVQRATVLQHAGRHEQAIADWRRVLALRSGARRMVQASDLNSLAYAQALGEQDLDEALGHIEQALALIPEEPSLLRAAMLDTRGWLRYRVGELSGALEDLDLALEIAEADYRQFQGSLRQLPVSDSRRIDAERRRQAQMVAVVRYHRARVHAARGADELAEEDRQRVRELGFVPDERLF